MRGLRLVVAMVTMPVAVLMSEPVKGQTYPTVPPVSEDLPRLQSAPQSFSFVPRARAYRYVTPVEVYAGRNAIIDFRTGEAIEFIQLSDPSQVVYETNAPLESGTGKTIVLRLIEAIEFPGQPQSPRPNLTVMTVDSTGQHRTYQFELVLYRTQPSLQDTSGVAIVPSGIAERERIAMNQVRRNQMAGLLVNQISTRLGTADVEDVERGLQIAIERGYTPANDPIVVQVREAMTQARRQGIPLREAVEQLGIPQQVMVALAEIGIEAGLLEPRANQNQARPVSTQVSSSVSKSSAAQDKSEAALSDWQNANIPSFPVDEDEL